MNEKLEKLNQEIEKTEKKLRRAQHEEKILEHQIKTLTRKERTHRLCTRAAMLESYLPHPEAITDEQVSLFLKLLFRQDSTRQPQPVDCPSERGRNYTPVEPVRCVLPEAPCREQMISADFQSVPIITGEATLPLRWLPPATPLWTCCPETPCATSCSRPASFISQAILIYGNLV